MPLELSLKNLKRCVVEPVVVNTVSKCIVSASTLSKSLGLELKDSFVQEKYKRPNKIKMVILTDGC